MLCDSAANAMARPRSRGADGACSPAVSATQFALLTSLSSVGLRVFGSLAATVVRAFGWPGFFVTTAVLALPGLILAWWAARRTTR